MAAQQRGFLDLVKLIEEKSAPNRRDEEHASITHYVNMFLGKFGKEGCLLAGSTTERTRVRLNRNEADSDFLLICGKAEIPSTCLVYNKECPCFVQIKGDELKQRFDDVDLVDGLYVPADLLRDVRPEAFSLLRIIHKALTRSIHSVGDETPRDEIPTKSKVGIELIGIRGANMYEKRKSASGHTCVKELNSRERKVADVFKVICEILMNLKNPEASKDMLKRNIPLLFQSFVLGQLDLVEGQDDINQITQHVEEEINLQDDRQAGSNPESSSQNKKNVNVRYESVASKDYVPCFRLAGTPAGFEGWVYREREWPRNEIVEDIAKSEFFLVAKPALVNTRLDADFCLSFTIPEKKLFDEVYKVPIQRKCYLAIKAIHKAGLNDQKILKTFHWKTAFFWVSERQRTWNDDCLLIAVLDIIDLMITSLEKRELNHFFLKSNLFVHLKAADMNQEVESLISTLRKIRADPTSSLRRFLKIDESSEEAETTLSKSAVDEARKARRIQAGSAGAKRFNEAVTGIVHEKSRGSGQSGEAGGTGNNNSDMSEFVDVVADVGKQIGQDAKDNKVFLTSLEKPLLSGQEADLISRAAELLSTNTGDQSSSASQIEQLSRDIAEHVVPKKKRTTEMEDFDLD